jgi:hypothetical protein
MELSRINDLVVVADSAPKQITIWLLVVRQDLTDHYYTRSSIRMEHRKARVDVEGGSFPNNLIA